MKSLMMTKYGDVIISLEVQEVSLPTVGANQILIKTHSASFNPIDYKILRGDFKAMGKIQFPRGIGRDVSGVIKEVGEKVKQLKVGNKVYSRIDDNFVGTMAE
jgi:NADPH:quinone reductase-like Zn-dependent oxidoreductase